MAKLETTSHCSLWSPGDSASHVPVPRAMDWKRAIAGRQLKPAHADLRCSDSDVCAMTTALPSATATAQRARAHRRRPGFSANVPSGARFSRHPSPGPASRGSASAATAQQPTTRGCRQSPSCNEITHHASAAARHRPRPPTVHLPARAFRPPRHVGSHPACRPPQRRSHCSPFQDSTGRAGAWARHPPAAVSSATASRGPHENAPGLPASCQFLLVRRPPG